MDRKEQKKAYREANKDKIKAYQKEWRAKNKEYMKEWRAKNKERIKEYDEGYQKGYQKEWREKNKDKIKEGREENKEKLKEYRKTPNCIKSRIITGWKYKGLISEDYDVLYDRYIKSTNCDECGCDYGNKGDGSSSWRCMDHDHETGLFRNFLCNRCNLIRG